MTDESELFREQATSWRPVLFGPAFALLGYLAELALGGPSHPVVWVGAGVVLAALTAPWIAARRRFFTVRVTPTTLWQGRESLPLERVAAVTDVEARAGARLLGGGWTTPRGYTELPLRLVDDTVVLAWAADVAGLAAAVRGVVEPDVEH